MPLISQVERKSLEGRVIVAVILFLLGLGSVTMVVPFLMTLTASVSNAYDLEKYHLIPRYLWDDDELYLKFLFEKYPPGYFRNLKSTHRLASVTSVRDLIRADQPADLLPEIHAYHQGPRPNYKAIRRDYLEFLSTVPLEKMKSPSFTYILTEQWGRWLRERYLTQADKQGLLKGTSNPEQVALDLMNKHYGEIMTENFNLVMLPEGVGYAPKSFWRNEKQARDFQDFLRQSHVPSISPQRGDDQYSWFLNQKYGTVESLNAAWGTHLQDFVQVILPPKPPAHPAQRADRQAFLETGARLSWMTIPESYAKAFRSFLRQQFGRLDRLADRLGTSFSSWDQIPFTTRYQGPRAYRELWSTFVLKHVPVPDRNIAYFEKEYAEFLKASYGTAAALSQAYGLPILSIENFGLPYAEMDYDEFYHQRPTWRWYFLTHNFAVVIRFIATKGRALWNTLVLVGLTVLGGLTLNPIAAYALSRYHLSNLQLVLLFLLVPMAFPPEVSMIPSFLLLRSFPIMVVITIAVAAAAVLVWRNVMGSVFRDRRFWNAIGVLGAVALAVGIVPLMYRSMGWSKEIPLLNTYIALILPGLANGFSIFLLKGFFDGLPRELYEAAQIDGASELRMFGMITYPLSKPILVVTVMGSALGAYGGFMWAFVVVPDERMWTLMVWLYQFSGDYAGYSMSLVMAALVVASIPTLLFFAFCQRIILRGIILPVMK